MKKKIKKNQVVGPILPVSKSNMSPEEEMKLTANLEKFIATTMNAFDKHQQIEAKENSEEKEAHRDIKHLDGVVAEFLKCFTIIGYDMSGRKVLVVHAKTSQDNDSLVEHLRETFFRIMSNVENSGS
mgnify:CR=1 FL=1